MANIYDVANELSRTLRDLPEYKAVVESKQAIEANPVSYTHLDVYKRQGQSKQGINCLYPKLDQFEDKSSYLRT